ncbi:hypothetical protein BCR43DRAFT_490250 [Syncephalastrum racemosum]|uniref:intramembrane prenyl-peptidase Rce1 n=1 Tax=Syncephalastrum racemosum TaxID=13706 RepID=A0A1X2HFI8_SYNRA|nr:hypothetical protein BCR43DRAFT_490250 [Syncephalastrum racemosum]
MLSAAGANVACIGFASLYVGGFYVFRTAHPNLSRNDPAVITERIKAVLAASALTALLVWLSTSNTYPLYERLGLGFGTVQGLLSPLLLVAVLFLGPLVHLGFERSLPFQKGFNWRDQLQDTFGTVVGLRNYVVGPATEEWVFRACVITVLHEAQYSHAYLIFASPVYFGLAHLHHAWEKYRQGGSTTEALRAAIFSSAFQFTYTTLFGWFVSFVFLRLGRLWPVILCHSFCNMMGFPDMGDVRHRPAWERKVIWTAFYIGPILFFALIYPLTDPQLVNGSIYWST